MESNIRVNLFERKTLAAFFFCFIGVLIFNASWWRSSHWKKKKINKKQTIVLF